MAAATPDLDAVYAHDKAEMQRMRSLHPWRQESAIFLAIVRTVTHFYSPHHFKNVKISALALLKMARYYFGMLDTSGLFPGHARLQRR